MRQHSLGFYLRQLRRHKDITLDNLSLACGLSKSYLILVEGNRREPSLTALKGICEALSVPVSYIIYSWERQL